MRSLAFASRSHARALVAGLPRQDHVLITTEQLVRFHKTNSMKCFVNWTPLNTHMHFNKPQPYLKVGLGRVGFFG